MSHVVVFSGPTVGASEVLAHLPDAKWRGPAARGDVYRAALEAPSAIALIDGYFEHRPAVTHKEILWAMSRGIPVFGAASMGALRAAELHELGMVGCGVIFADLAAGRLEDDDEVAVVHAGAEHAYRAGSEAMVNLRATIAAALQRGVVSQQLAEAFLVCAKNLFYPSRDYARVLEELTATGQDPPAITALEGWLAVSEHRVDQKRLDALEMLTNLGRSLETGALEKPPIKWAFPKTSAFCRLADEVGRPHRSALSHAITEEIQLLGPETYSDIIASASLRALAASLDSAVPAPPARRVSAAEDFAEEERRILQQMPKVHELVLYEVESVLRALGDYDRVAARASKKAGLCADLGAPRSGELAESVEAYFHSVLRRELPANLGKFATSVGFSSVAKFTAAIRKELYFLRRLSSSES